MRQQTTTACQALAVLVLAILLNPPATVFGDDERTQPESVIKTIPERSHQAIERGLDYLEKDVVKWRDERQCATCHHGTMTVWTYLEAKSRGYHVPPETIRETVQWTKDRLLERIDLPRDTRPGWSMVNSSAIHLALAATIIPRQDAITADELTRIVDHLVRHQESDGAWKWSSAPPKNRPPPFFESDEIATRLASLALAAKKPKDDAEATVV
ncbi:MAG: hypothetical protein NT069_00045, partial [Planctomycetota bacterium]|nr:hypothetical protein [Planctomycetota bacterium]